ncbi:MAG: hypothetical protein EAY75_10870 [Bacteroidetes bacterium]|nr:MAG: hypothetical protein EAY75_10870 [Bacteroidota bacterium]
MWCTTRAAIAANATMDYPPARSKIQKPNQINFEPALMPWPLRETPLQIRCQALAAKKKLEHRP